MKTIQEQIKEIENKIEELDRSRFAQYTYNPKRNEAIMRQMRELGQQKGELLKQLAKEEGK